MEVSVRELKNRLSEYLRRVQSGEQILVTSHGKPVGQLIGPPAEANDSEVDALAKLTAQSRVRSGGKGRIRGARNAIKARRGERLSEILLERE